MNGGAAALRGLLQVGSKFHIKINKFYWFAFISLGKRILKLCSDSCCLKLS
jgi:hypothetical protein